MADAVAAPSTARPTRPTRVASGTILDTRGLDPRFGGLKWTVTEQKGDGSVIISRKSGNAFSTDTLTADQYKRALKIRPPRDKKPSAYRLNETKDFPNGRFEILSQDANEGQNLIRLTTGGKTYEAWVDNELLNKSKPYTSIFPDDFFDKLAAQVAPLNPLSLAASLGSKSSIKKLADQKKKGVEETAEKEEPKKEEEKPAEEKKEVKEEKEDVVKEIQAVPEQAAPSVEVQPKTPKTISDYRGLRADTNFDRQLQTTSWQILATLGAAIGKAYSGIDDKGQLIKVNGEISNQKAFDLIPKNFKLPVVSRAMVQFADNPQATKYNLVSAQIIQPPIDMPALASQISVAITSSISTTGPSVAGALTGFQAQIAQNIAKLDQNLTILNGNLGKYDRDRQNIVAQLKQLGTQLNQQVGSGDSNAQNQTTQRITQLQQQQKRLMTTVGDTQTMIGQERRKKENLQSFKERTEGRNQATEDEQKEFIANAPIILMEKSEVPPPTIRAVPLPAGPSTAELRTRIKKQIGAPLQSRGYESSAETKGAGMTSDRLPETILSDAREEGLSGAEGEREGWSDGVVNRFQAPENEDEISGGGYVKPLGEELRRMRAERKKQVETQRGLLGPEIQMTTDEGRLQETPDREFNPELEENMPEEMGEQRSTEQNPDELARQEGAEQQAAANIQKQQTMAARSAGNLDKSANILSARAQAATEKVKSFWRVVGWFDKAFDLVGGSADGIQLVKLIIGYDIALVRSAIFKDKSVNPLAPQTLLPEKDAYIECCIAAVFHFLFGLQCCLVFIIGFVVIFGPAIIFSGLLLTALQTIGRAIRR